MTMTAIKRESELLYRLHASALMHLHIPTSTSLRTASWRKLTRAAIFVCGFVGHNYASVFQSLKARVDWANK